MSPREHALSNPSAEYAQRLESFRKQRVDLSKREEIVPRLQAAVLLFGVGYTLLNILEINLLYPISCAVVFAALVWWQQRIRKAGRQFDRLVNYYQRGLARLAGSWPGSDDQTKSFAPLEHAYALDLDLFGSGSLFERLSTARTEAGARTLADWLLAPAKPDEICRRHEAIDDLRNRLDLREEIYLRSADVPPGIDLDGLIRWGAAPSILPGWFGSRLVAALLIASALIVIGASAGYIPWFWVRALAIAPVVFWLFFFGRIVRVVAPVRRRLGELRVFYALLLRIERERFQSAALTQVQGSLRVFGQPPSRCIQRLAKLVAKLWIMGQPEFRWIGWTTMLTTRVAFDLEAWRRIHGRHIGQWLAATASFEALSSIATYAYENPDDPFPELVSQSPFFEATRMGHPLLARERCTTNDLSLDHDCQGLIVTGSNMSGKSTLLRTVGANVVLAMAGAPIRASRLRLSPLTLSASIRVQDSLQAGQSRFLAEIRRLRQMVDLARSSTPLLFLIDEVLQGTNPIDRNQGSSAVICELLRNQAIGLVTTHDLPLTALADRPNSRLKNVHFVDKLEDGRLSFDHRMRAGVLPRNNALALMREIGLNVADMETA